MEALMSYFESQGLTAAEARKVASAFVSKNLEKGDHFVEEGKISKQLGFIKNGFLQYYLRPCWCSSPTSILTFPNAHSQNYPS